MNYIKQLKVKIKSLAAESRIIRLEASRTKNLSAKNDMSNHRTGIVRSEARWSLIAYGFLRGRKYSDIEPTSTTLVSWGRVQKLVDKFGCHYYYDSKENWQDFCVRKELQDKALTIWISEAITYRKDYEESKKAA